MKSFGDRLRALRKEREMTGEKLAQELGLTRRTLVNYESGNREPTIAMLGEIAEFFDVSIDYLTGKTDDPAPPTPLPLTTQQAAAWRLLLENPELLGVLQKVTNSKTVSPKRIVKALELLIPDDENIDEE